MMTRHQVGQIIVLAERLGLPADPNRLILIIAKRGRDARYGTPEAVICHAVHSGRDTPDTLTEAEGEALIGCLRGWHSPAAPPGNRLN